MGLVQGHDTVRSIAKRYGLASSSVGRHLQNHVPKFLATFGTRVNALEADQILAQVLQLYERTLKALDEAESFAADTDKARAVPSLIREARQTLETLTKVSVQLADAADSGTQTVGNELEAEIRASLARMRTGPMHGPVAAIDAGDDEPAPAEIVEE